MIILWQACDILRRAMIACYCFFFGSIAFSHDSKAGDFSLDVVPIHHFQLFDPDRIRFGDLEFLGGLELSSDNENFGGFSGLAWIDDQRFVAITDRGMAFSGILMKSAGKPVAVEQAEIRFLPGLNSGVARWKRDAEGFDISGDRAFVSFEGAHRLQSYQVENGRLTRPLARISLDRTILGVNRGNKGLETVAIAPPASSLAGATILISERAVDGVIEGWILHSGKSEGFRFAQKGDFLVTDAAFTHEGDLIVLERDFSLLGGLHIHIRHIHAEALKAGVISKFETLFEGSWQHELDNMEGLAIQEMSNGDSLLTLVSDDNFSSLQRTLLLQFLLKSEPISRAQ